LSVLAGSVASIDGPTLVASVGALLARYTGRSELVLGYVAGEDARPLVLALEPDGEETFQQLVARVSSALSTSEQGSWGSRAPDAVVALEQEPPADAPPSPWLVARRNASSWHLALRSGGSPEVVGVPEKRFMGHLCTLLEATLANPDQPIGALQLLTDAERQRLLVEWNDTSAPYPNACLHELFAEQARTAPQAIALECCKQPLTYEQLDARANQLAHHLRRLGVGPEVLVGLCLERSLEMVIGLLGILKAGGAYVPIDPAYPAERQEYMLSHSQAPVVVTQRTLLERFPLGDAQVVCLDGESREIAALPDEAPAVPADPEQLAYVIYTSGSTGKPKGVQISHRALVNFLCTMQREPGLTADDVLVAVTTLSFDIAGLELYLPLITGARVVIAPAETASDPRGLAELLRCSGATVMQATPTTWRMLVESGWDGNPTLKGLCGGEALPAALAEQLVSLGVELWNMYGPTETTIWSTCSRVREAESITIGRPIANTSLYILDSHLHPVPIGVAAELWIGGDGVARGYRGRADLTAERFVADPSAGSPGSRVYRTGDLARYREDGTVEYLGRIDHQVKVRGFRIELGEIETVLSSHPSVAGAVVVARRSGDEAELAAYVIPGGVPVAAQSLRQFLARKLPAYMVPSTVTTVEAFPLTANGKVDRNALPEPTRERSDDHELVAPRTGLERRLAAIWERELAIAPIGVTDNFFDLGVTSIAAASLFAAIEHDLGDKLPLGAIFRAPTIEALARLLEADDAQSRWTSLVPIQPAGSQVPIFCVHGGAGTILHLEPLARRLGGDQPFYGLQSRGLYGGAAPLATVEDMTSHYLSEMQEVHRRGPWRLAGYCFGAIVAFEMAQRLLRAGEEVELLAIFNGPSPAWIRRWGWYGNQPSKRADTLAQMHRGRKQRLQAQARRLRRALREPRRFGTALEWYSWRIGGQLRTRLALALGRPLPEEVREEYFLRLHAEAERAYEPEPYPEDLLIFSGENLYEDPELGWGELAKGGIRAYAVPGNHDNNRQAMSEPFVAFISERLQAHLGQMVHPQSRGRGGEQAGDETAISWTAGRRASPAVRQ
jgi:amino acid adenylation domain-containing protein